MPDDLVNVRYMVSGVQESIDFYTQHFGFQLGRSMPDGRRPEPGGWNRIHFVVGDINDEVARLRAAGVAFRNEIITGPGGQQILIDDPSGNPIELFQPAGT